MMDWAPNVASQLGQQLLYAAVTAAVVALIIKFTHVKSPLLRQGLWSLVLLRLVLPTDLSSPLSLRGVGEEMASAAQGTFLQEQIATASSSLKSKKSEEPVMTLPSPTQPVAFEGRYERAKLLPLGDALLSKRKQESVAFLD
ncbi:MAG: hypothetical protein PVF65_08720, partial [Sphingomonadales bacterium]